MTDEDRGRAIAAMRVSLCLTPGELARLLEVSTARVKRWETYGAPKLAELAVAFLSHSLSRP